MILKIKRKSPPYTKYDIRKCRIRRRIIENSFEFPYHLLYQILLYDSALRLSWNEIFLGTINYSGINKWYHDMILKENFFSLNFHFHMHIVESRFHIKSVLSYSNILETINFCCSCGYHRYETYHHYKCISLRRLFTL